MTASLPPLVGVGPVWLGRFLSKLPAPLPGEGCWLWQGTMFATGYGALRADGLNHRAHRLSYTLWVGQIPDGLFVLHRCDTPACVRPDHLFLGTQADNIADMFQKQRACKAHGEAHPRACLTERDVRAIRDAIGHGESQRDIAARYGITPAAVSHIKVRRTWAHVV